VAATVQDELIGTTLGHAVIREVLGQGGMAVVYRGYQQNLDRDVAIKVLPPTYAADQAFVERFKLEARAMARLSHPNIVTIHDAGEENRHLYIVMAYIAGGTLKDRLGTPLDLRVAARHIRDVASALAYAHERGIVHRDVKPANVLLDTEGRGILSDFGIAKVLASSEGLTHIGAGVGTPEYMSPEQCRGAAVDARADIYALGVLAYEMLTGRTPFVADNYAALAHAHIYEAVPPPNRFNPRISPAVQAVVLMALAKEPAYRFQHALEMASAFEQAVAAQMPMAPLAVRRQTSAPANRPLPPPVECPRCRQANAPFQRFCSNCGSPLGAAMQAQPPAYSPQMLASAAAAYVTCTRCQAANVPNNRYCTRCGQPLGPAGVTCRHCGAANAHGQRFCTTCGQPMT
jgi:serine/threonine protein kinase